jgi:PAS domain S-box-containing protein
MATILVVDDHPENRRFLALLLGSAGHRILQAGDGAEGLAVAQGERPDLIITDLLMPTMDGFELVRRLRAEPALADVRVIFYTATYVEKDARTLAESCGVARILTKPAGSELVLSVVSEVLGVDAPPQPKPVPLGEFQSEHLRLLNVTLAHKAEVVVPRLNAIIALSVQLASELDPSHLLDMFCAGARNILGAKYALVSIVRKAHADDRQLFSCGLDRATMDWLPAVWPAHGRFVQLTKDRRAFRATSDPGLPPGLPPAQSFLVVAIHSPAAIYGWLCLAERIGAAEFSDEEEQLAAILSGLVGRIYENGSLYAASRRNAEDLARSEQRFRQLAENIPEVFFVAETEPFQIIYISPAYETVWGRSVASLYERSASWLEAVVPEDQAASYAFLEKALRGEEGARQEYRVRRPDGSVRWVLAQTFPVRGASGRPERIAGIARDITEDKRASEELRESARSFRDAGQRSPRLTDARPKRAHHVLQRLLPRSHGLAARRGPGR